MQPSIVLVGHVCIDHNINEHAQYENWGSSVLYMATYWQRRQQLKPAILTTYGPDFAPFLQAFRLYPSAPTTSETLIFENTSKNGHQTQRCLHAETALAPELSSETRDLLADAAVVVVAPLIDNYPVAFVRDVLSACAPDAIKVFVAHGYFRQITADGRIQQQLSPAVDELIPFFDVTVYSEADREEAFSYAQQITRRTDTAVIVTQGADGASIARNGHLTHIATEPVAEEDIVDSVGCGDTFTAGLTQALASGASLEDAVIEGHKAAREKLFSTPA